MIKRLAHKIFFFWRLPKKVFIPIIVLLIIGSWFFLFRGEKTQPIELTDVKRHDIKSTVSASGKLTGKESVDLKFKSSGKITFLDVKEGETVQKGQQIANLDTRALQIALQQSRNTLNDKQATAQKVEDDVKGHDSDETFEQKAERTTAQAASNNAFEAVKAAEVALQDGSMISPITGVVTKVNALVGQTVSIGETVVQIVNDEEVIFEAEVDESDIGKIAVGQTTEVTLNSDGDKIFNGTIQQILPVTEETSTGATIVIARILLTNPPATFVNGINGQAEIIYKQQSNVLTIPQEALMEDSTVYIEKNSSYQKVKVTTGIQSDTDIEINSGLSDGQKVVKNPSAVKLTTNSSSPFDFLKGK